MKWMAGALALIGATLVILSWRMERDLNQAKVEWRESWSHTFELNRVVPEEKILKEGPCRVELAIPNDIHWKRIAGRMKNPRLIVFGRQPGENPFKDVPVKYLESIPASFKINDSQVSPTAALAYVNVDERRVPRWGVEVPVELGDRIEVTLAARPGKDPRQGDLSLMTYFHPDKAHSVYSDWALDELFIRILRWTGLGLIAVSAVMLFLVMRKVKPTEARGDGPTSLRRGSGPPA